MEIGNIANATNKQKGNFGEMCTDMDVEKNGPISRKGMEPSVKATRVGPKEGRVTSLDQPGHQGIDGIYKCDPPPPAYIVVEAKYGKSQLGTTEKGMIKQMSDPWLQGKGRIDKYFGVTPDTPSGDPRRIEMNSFLDANADKNVQKELSRVDSNGNVVRTLLQ